MKKERWKGQEARRRTEGRGKKREKQGEGQVSFYYRGGGTAGKEVGGCRIKKSD